MARNIVGASAKELRDVRQEMIAMLKADGPAPTGRFADLQYLMPVKDYQGAARLDPAGVRCRGRRARQIEEKRASAA
jgi:NifU-like protein involved in Fe-S cluster formation